MVHFLDLPRELRDHIYAYVLVRPQILTKNPRYTSYNHRFRIPELALVSKTRFENLSLLRVSQQVHAEASEVFYKLNVWPIRVVLARRCAQSPDCKNRLHVSYEAPWEEIAYGAKGDGSIGKFFDSERFFCDTSIGELEPKRAIMGTDPDLYPAPRYRKFLRKVNVEIIDIKSRTIGSDGLEGDDGERSIAAARTTLLPFMRRLKRLLDPAGDAVTVKIRPVTYLRSDSRSQIPRGFPRSSWDNSLKARSPDNMLFAGDVLMLAIIWPLTKEGWRYDINIDLEAEEFRAVKDKVKERCEGSSPDGMKRITLFEGAKVTGDCYFATVKGRMRLVRNGMRYSQCYECDRTELERVCENIDAAGEERRPRLI